MTQTQPRRPGAFLRGHLLMFDRRDPPSYAAPAGWTLLVVFALFELALGPRLEHLALLGVSVPEPVLRLPLQIAAVLAMVRLAARLRWREIGLLPLAQWTATEGLYFVQVVIVAGAVFYVLYLRAVPPGLWQAAGTIVLTQMLWGFYQELMYRGLLQTELTRRFGTLWGALIANLAFTFGPLHFFYSSAALPDANAVIVALIFGIGAFFAVIFARTRNLWIVGIFHGIGNVFINGGAEIRALLS